MADHSVSGSCLCGEIQFGFSGKPAGCGHCHCATCRRAHGAPIVTWVVLLEKQFNLAKGDISWYESSPGTHRGFCPHCGTTMFFKSHRCPGEIHVVRASLPEETEIRPTFHVFIDHKASWWSPDDSLPTFTSDSPELARYRDKPG